MEALVGVIVGGALTVVVQWFVTPRVERRIRQQERFEDALLALGELLTVDIPRARAAVTAAGRGLALTDRAVSEGRRSWDEERIQVEWHQDLDALMKALDDWRTLTNHRLTLLADRVGERFGVVHRQYQLAAIQVPSLLSDFIDATDDEQEAKWKAEYDARVALLTLVEAKQAPHDPNRRSIGTRIKKRIFRRRTEALKAGS